MPSSFDSTGPATPTVAESGIPGYEVNNWYAMVAPAKTPKAVIARLNRELVTILNDPEIKRLCAERASAGVIRDYALSHGMVTLRQSGYRKVAEGVTTLDEVVRITRGDVA